MPATVDLHPNLAATLDMIAWSEGTSIILNSNDGYLAIIGGKLFHSYHDHPFNDPDRPKIWIERIKDYSTASGRYQIRKSIFNYYRKTLNLNGPDFFRPENQDSITIKLIHECHAFDDIHDGRIAIAIDKCKSRWASFPGANYQGQHMNKIDALMAEYQKNGGWLA